MAMGLLANPTSSEKGNLMLKITGSANRHSGTANRHSGASRNLAAQFAITVTAPTAINSGLRRNDGLVGWDDGLEGLE